MYGCFTTEIRPSSRKSATASQIVPELYHVIPAYGGQPSTSYIPCAPALSFMPRDLLIIVTYHLLVRDILNLEMVSRDMRDKMREPAIWSAVLRDIWTYKPRLYRPNIVGLAWHKLRRLVIHEAKLDKQLSSVFTSKLLRTIDLPPGELLCGVGFVPNGGGRFLASWLGGRVDLFSSQGDVLQSVPGMCETAEISQLWNRPIAADTAHTIQIQRSESYMSSATPSKVRVMRVNGNELSVLTTMTSSTRAFAGDVTKQSFAFLSHSVHHKDYIELHVHGIPGCSSPFPGTGLVLKLKGFRAQYVGGIVRNASVVFLGTTRILLGSGRGFAAYELLCSENLATHDRFPYWTHELEPAPMYHHSSSPIMSIVPTMGQQGFDQFVAFTGQHVRLLSIPMGDIATSTPAAKTMPTELHHGDHDAARLDTTSGILAMRKTRAGLGRVVVAIRAGSESDRTQVRLDCSSDGWISRGLDLQQQAQDGYTDQTVDLDEDTGRVLVFSLGWDTPGWDHKVAYSRISLYSLLS